MLEIILGIIIVLIGGLFALQGSSIMRIAFALAGFVGGFTAGAGMVSSITGDSFLSTMFGWLIGFFVAILFASLAYYYFAFAVVFAFAGFGATLATALLSVFNLNWSWLVALVSVIGAVIFGILAISKRLPMTVLVVILSFLGSGLIIYGLMLVFNLANFGDFSNGRVYEVIRINLGVYLLWASIAISSCIAQFRAIALHEKMSSEYWQKSMTLNEIFIIDHAPKTKHSKKK